MVNETELTCLMGSMSTVLIAALASTAGTYAFQRLITNRRGSEISVTKRLDQIAEGTWTFVALQYYFGIMNRTYLVFVNKSLLCGAKVKGMISAPRAPDARWKDPHFYVSPEMASKYATMDLASAEFLSRCRANFRIARSEIRDVEFSQKPKWGMATVPYSGRIFLRMKGGESIELILLGNQDGPRICAHLQATLKEPR